MNATRHELDCWKVDEMSCRWDAGGEVDARACYTAMAAAHMLRLDVAGFAREASMVDFLQRCQVCANLHMASAGARLGTCRPHYGQSLPMLVVQPLRNDLVV